MSRAATGHRHFNYRRMLLRIYAHGTAYVLATPRHGICRHRHSVAFTFTRYQ